MALPINPDDPGQSGGTGGGNSGGGGSATYGTTVFALNFTKRDADSALEVIVYLNCASNDDLQFSAYFSIDGTFYQVGGLNTTFTGTQSAAMATATLYAIVPGIAAGARSAVLQIKNREPDDALRILSGSVLKIAELRQAAR